MSLEISQLSAPLSLITSVCVALSLVGCNGGDGFGSILQDSSTSGDCSNLISSTPDAGTLRVSTSGQNTTFGVVYSGTCTVRYYINGTLNNKNNGNTFISLSATDFSVGTNVLKAEASDGSTSSSKSWTVVRNAPPTISTQNPTSLGNTITSTGNITLSAVVSDSNSDSMTASWLLNGGTAAGLFAATPSGVVNSGTTVQAVFSPTSAQIGTNVVTLKVNDGYDDTTITWTITVTDNSTATVTSCSPGTTSPGAPDVITESGANSTRTYSVNALGTGITYKWLLKGPSDTTFTQISGQTTAVATLTRNEVPIAAGVYTLTAEVKDAYNNTAQCPSFIYVKSNGKPTFAGTATPSTSTTKSLNVRAGAGSTSLYGSPITFTPGSGGAATDANGDTLTYTWSLDGSPSTALSSGSFTSTFTPAGDASLLGNHVVQLSVTDGYETATKSWNINVNHFSAFCNDAVAGEICTLVGNPGVGDGLDPTEDQTKIRIQPRYFTLHTVGGVKNPIFTDNINQTVWYYNRTASPVTYFGKTIGAGKIAVLFGSGVASQATTYSLSSPTKAQTVLGVALNADDAANPVLFLSLYGNNRVISIDNTGTITEMFRGTDVATDNMSVTATGASGVSCTNPYGIDYDSVRKRLYVNCYTNNTLRTINLDSSDPTTYMKSTIIVRRTNQTMDGAAGVGQAASTVHPRGLKVDSSGNVFWVEGCAGGTTYRRGGTVRVYVPSGSFTFGSVTVTAGNVGTLIGAETLAPTSCTNTWGTSTALTSSILNDAFDLALYPSTGTVTGLFIGIRGLHRVLFANSTGSAQTFGGLSGSTSPTSIPDSRMNYSLGSGVVTNTSDGGPGILTQVSSPEGLKVDGNNLYFSDFGFFRLRSMDLTSGVVSTIAGAGYQRLGGAPSGNVAATEVFLNSPHDIAYNPVSGNLYYTDNGNLRINQVNMNTGIVSVFAGNGSTNYSDGVQAALAGMGSPLGLASTGTLPSASALFGNQLVFADTSATAGSGQPCLFRGINNNSGTTALFGTNITTGDVASFAGKLLGAPGGCISTATTDNNTFSGTANTIPLFYQSNLNGLARSMAIAQDNAGNPVLYVAITERNCILKVDASGAMSVAIGICQASGADAGNVAISNSSAQLIYPKGIYTDPAYPTNIFIADQTHAGTPKIKYANFSTTTPAVVFNNLTVPINTLSGAIFNITSGTPILNSVAASANYVCYSTGNNSTYDLGFNNVKCKNRALSSGASAVIQCGADDNTVRDGSLLGYEQERKSCLTSDIDGSILLAGPSGLEFDAAGNLYIAERRSHVIRRIKAW